MNDLSSASIVVSLIKVLTVVMFLLNMAAIGVWLDRRQSAMVQDRVGPNRAVVYLPALAVRLILLLPAIGLAAVVGTTFWWLQPREIVPGLIGGGLQLGVLVAWSGLLLLSNHVRDSAPENAIDALVASVDPRHYFYAGLVVHLGLFPLARLVPSSVYEVDGIRWASGLAGSFAAVVLMVSGFYAAAKVPSGRIGIRLAGTLHAVADAIKLIWKEDLRPQNADRLLFALAPLLAMFPALVTIGVIPFGSTLCVVDGGQRGVLDWADLIDIGGTNAAGQCLPGQLPIGFQVADLNVGLLYIFAIAGTGIIGAALAGWASDSKFALLGGLRATSQMVSYEVALGLAVVGMLMITGSVHLGHVVDWQGANAWGIFVQPLGFVLFLTALIAETKRVPFDQPEGESEIVAGYFLEYSGMKFGLFFLGEYAEFTFSSALLVTLFFGGYHLPFIEPHGIRVAVGDTVLFQAPLGHLWITLLHCATFFGKTVLVTWLQVFIRWTLPRFRYDQLMKLGWTKLLPLALVNIMVTGAVILATDQSATFAKVLGIAADLSQMLVAGGGLVAVVALVSWLLEPAKRPLFRRSSSARYAAAAGGVRARELEA